MESAAGLVGIIVKFTARVKRRKYQPLRTDALFVHPHGNAASVVRYGGGTVRFQRHPDGIAKARQMLVHRVVHDFVD